MTLLPVDCACTTSLTLFTTKVSLPVPPTSVATPLPATSVSLPEFAVIVLFRPLPVSARFALPLPVRFCTLAGVT